MALTFADGKTYEDETAFLVGVPETAPTASITVTPINNIPVQPHPNLLEDDAVIPSPHQQLKDAEGVMEVLQGVPEIGAGEIELQRGQRLEDERQYPGLGERMSDAVDYIGMGQLAMARLTNPGDPTNPMFSPRGTQAQGGGGYAPARRNEPEPGPVERSGVNVYNRELRRDPESGRYNPQPEEFGGRPGVLPHAEQNAVRELSNATAAVRRAPRGWESVESTRYNRQSLDDIPPFLQRTGPQQTAAEMRAEKAIQLRTGHVPRSHTTVPFKDRDGASGEVELRLTNGGKNIDIQWIGAPNTGFRSGVEPHSMGLAETRKLLKQLHEKFPQAETVTGYRVSGARDQSGAGAMEGFMKFPKSWFNKEK